MSDQKQQEKHKWMIFAEDGCGATQTYGISYPAEVGIHILCTGMYKFQADWLLEQLKDKEGPSR